MNDLNAKLGRGLADLRKDWEAAINDLKHNVSRIGQELDYFKSNDF